MLPLLEKNIADLVQDATPIRKILNAIRDDLTPTLINSLSPISEIEDQAPKVRKAQRRLADCNTLAIQKNSNKQEAKELVKSLEDLKKTQSSVKPILDRLLIRRVELEKELEEVKTAIEGHKSTLSNIPDAIQSKKQEITAKIKEGKHIRSSLSCIPGTAEEDEQLIAEVNSLRLSALKAIHDALGL
jgi:chromosome segregation ATPase